jgi:hypothetical protein
VLTAYLQEVTTYGVLTLEDLPLHALATHIIKKRIPNMQGFSCRPGTRGARGQGVVVMLRRLVPSNVWWACYVVMLLCC